MCRGVASGEPAGEQFVNNKPAWCSQVTILFRLAEFAQHVQKHVLAEHAPHQSVLSSTTPSNSGKPQGGCL